MEAVALRTELAFYCCCYCCYCSGRDSQPDEGVHPPSLLNPNPCGITLPPPGGGPPPPKKNSCLILHLLSPCHRCFTGPLTHLPLPPTPPWRACWGHARTHAGTQPAAALPGGGRPRARRAAGGAAAAHLLVSALAAWSLTRPANRMVVVPFFLFFLHHPGGACILVQ